MFGYVKPYVPSLTVAEYEVYKGAYCGVCRAMGRLTGQLSRLSLSYDMAFLALFRMAALKTPSAFRRATCAAHPFSKRFIMNENDQLLYSAAVSSLLTLEKLNDNVADESGAKRLSSRVLLPSARHAARRAGDKYSVLGRDIQKQLAKLSDTEREKQPSIDAPAGIFAEALGDVFSFDADGDSARICREMGRRIGKIIYVLDAADDLEGDIRGEKYNSLALIYNDPFEKASDAETRCISDDTRGSFQKENSENSEKPEKSVKSEENKKKAKPKLKAEIADSLFTAVMLELERARSALSLVDSPEVKTYVSVVDNILSCGIPAEARRVLYGAKKTDDPLKYRV